MDSLSDHLNRWRDAGLIDASAAARIAEYEDARSAAQPTPERETAEGRPGVAEALVYLAAAVIGVGVWVLAGVSWESFNAPTRIAILTLSAAASLIAGTVIWGMDDPRLRRGASVVWLVAVFLCAAAAAVVADEASVPGEDIALIAAGAALLVSAALSGVSQRHPQIVALSSAALFGAFAVTVRGDLDSVQSIYTFGGLTALAGAAGVALVESDVLRPRSSGRAFSTLLLVIGASFVGFPPANAAAEMLTFAAGGVLIALSFWRRTIVYMGFGVMTLFVALVTAVLRHIDDPALAAFALIVAGLMLIVGVLFVTRLRSRVSSAAGSPA